MPGDYTFYAGSRLLEPVALMLNVGTDKLNVALCQLIALPLAYFHYKYLSFSKVSRSIRLLFPPIVGIIFCFFCYGSAIKHLLALTAVSYALIQYLPSIYVHKVVFIFSMSYLVFIHWYRWYEIQTSFDITGPMMIAVQKITVLAFSLHDGKVKSKETLSTIQMREALASVPSVSDYVSYIFHFQAVLTGPLCFYSNYLDWIDGIGSTNESGKWAAVMKKCTAVIIFLIAILLIGNRIDPLILIRDDFMQMNLFLYLLYTHFIMFTRRFPYYYAWTFADAIYNVSGIGFNGYDEFGNAKWDLTSNVFVWRFEMAISFKKALDSWNCCTMYWLRRVVYERAPARFRTVITYLVSAIWHGFYPGYYLTFLMGALFTLAARTGHICMRHRGQSSVISQRFHDSLTFIATKAAVAVATYPFVTLDLEPGLLFYRRMYFAPQIFALAVIFILPLCVSQLRMEGADKDRQSHNERKSQ